MSSCIFALDVGDRRIGLACSDPTGVLASPVGVYRRVAFHQDLDSVVDLVEQHDAGTVVVGLPVNMSGDEGPQAKKTRAFADGLRARGLIVSLWDERLTTVEATKLLRDRGMKPEKIERHVDEIAATLILESYLASQRPWVEDATF